MTPHAWLACALLLSSAGWVQAQTLAEIARAEEARRKTVEKPAKVYTNDDLRPDFTKPTPPTPPPPAGTEPGAAPAGETPAAGAPTAPEPGAAVEGGQRDQAYWSNRIGQARSQLERSRAFATALQNRVDMLWTDFVNRDDPAQRAVIERDRLSALAELERLKKEIEDHTKAIAEIEEEARRAGVPPGWLRPS